MYQYPKNELAQTVIASCIAHDIAHVVISPGSRNAPLTIGFSNQPSIKAYSIVDERCAAFFALGIAQQIKKPVAIVCTSGSALLNYYPAISEAYYSNIPLIVISADRPKHLIDIGDGQTINQENVFKNHILYSANLSDAADAINLLQKAFHEAIHQQGPVHINAPFEEPLYDVVDELLVLDKVLVDKSENPLEVDFLQEYADIWNGSSKKMVLIGENFPEELIQIQMDKMIEDESVIVLTETTSNLSNENFINSIDKVIASFSDEDKEAFKPEILLTFGGMVVSKKIKQFLRAYQPKHHWHVDSKRAYDTYFSLNHHFKISPQLFFSQFFFLTKEVKSAYQSTWLAIKNKRSDQHNSFLKSCDFSDLKVFDVLLNSIPNASLLQLSNSAIIRYTQLFDINPTLDLFCNRGTSGIDGSTSTAIGAANATKKQTVLITGDISFFYDSNALWNTNIPESFRIIIVNNDGGGIFKLIPGPQSTNAIDYFETPHGLSAEHLCTMYNLDYKSVATTKELESVLKTFYEVSDKPKVLEVKTPNEINDKILKQYFASLK